MTVSSDLGGPKASAGRPAPRFGPPLSALALIALVLILLLPSGITSALARTRQPKPEAPPPGELRFSRQSSFSPSSGLALDACWLGDQHLLVLSLGPGGAELLKAGLQPSASEVLVSSEILSQVCPPALHDRLRLQLSPGGHYLALQWFTDNGQRQLALLSLGVPAPALDMAAAAQPQPAADPPPADPPLTAAKKANNAVLELGVLAASGKPVQDAAAGAAEPGSAPVDAAVIPAPASWPQPDFAALSPADVHLVQLALPAGMQVGTLLFSPDDRYLVLAHDGFREGSDCSLLALDLQAGRQLWRLSPADLNFIHAMWWNSAVEHQGFAVSAEVHNGQFQAGPGIARFDLERMQWEFSPEQGNLLLYGEAPWGSAAAYQSAPKAAAPYHIKFSPRGGEPSQQKGSLLLNSEPVDLELLPDSGYALLVNRVEASEKQLWQFNLYNAKRYLVDGDCRRCELRPDGRLLVVGGQANELRVYQLTRPGQS
ncbi:hypothetical protein IT575_05465 [bacterium]|nr:hypothetical protein [bacterium]